MSPPFSAEEDISLSFLLQTRSCRHFGKRAAMNAPIQGAAADIIKIAMVRVYKKLREEDLDARLILQVHDELIIEAAEKDKDRAEKILKDEMETL